MMDFENFARKQLPQSDDSSNDSNFGSMRDNDSIVQDSDDDYVPISNRRSARKRFQTFQMTDSNHCGKVRKISSTSLFTDNGRTEKVERLPTRRPDPNVQNRNAIMARENRRKKKQHVEILENELEQNRREMKELRRILKEKDRAVEKLTHETLYLRSVIANKTDIMSLVKTIKGNKMPVTSSVLSFVTEDDQYNNRRMNGSDPSHSPTTSTCTSIGDEEMENDFDLGFCTSSTISDEIALGNWKSFLNDEEVLTKSTYIPALPQTDTNLSSNVKNEHNYYLNNITDAIKRKDRDGIVSPGICLHLAGGRISLEFCAACHSSSQNAWIEEL